MKGVFAFMKKLFYTLAIALIILISITLYLNTQAVKKTSSQSNKPGIGNNSNSSPNSSETSLGNKKKIIVIDPGHGGPDNGSSSKSGTLEKTITLKVALKLGPMLEARGYKVVYTRKDDNIQWISEKEDLLRRAKIANDANADLFISIHTNSTDLKNITGTETYYHQGSSEGKRFAQLVQNEVIEQVNTKDRGIKTEDFSVLRNVTAPSILLELGYISTPSEEAILKDSQYQSKFAEGITNGIVKYLEN